MGLGYVLQLVGAFRGLRPLLSKWMGHGFDRDLRRLTELLQTNSVKQAEEQVSQEASRLCSSRHIEKACNLKIHVSWKRHSSKLHNPMVLS